MTKLTASRAWQALVAHERRIGATHMRDLFAADPQRAARYSLEFGDLYLDYSKHRVTDETLQLLLALARQTDLPGWIARLFAGDAINVTERRPALHMALRSNLPAFPKAGGCMPNVMPAVRDVRKRMGDFAEALRESRVAGSTGKPIHHVVNLGIGGSDLGPRMAVRALRTCAVGGVEVYFVSNVDPADLDNVLSRLDPGATLFIIASKTFTTVETMSNARRARAWLSDRLGMPDTALTAHFAAVTAAADAAAAHGLAAERIFPMWDWVGGRFSLWSAVGLPVAIAIGPQAFAELLAGACEMDGHFCVAPLERNMPVLMALLSVWYGTFMGAQTHAVLPYSEALRDLPAYLQQLHMESNGKSVDREGCSVDYMTAPVLWGGTGTDSQHSFHQLLLQGTRLVPVDFILPVAAGYDSGADEAAQHMLVANALAQGAALLAGSVSPDPHRAAAGNRPSSTLLMKGLTPHSLGALIALYEHKVFAEAVLLNINPFDQWGVELGKALARAIGQGEHQALDRSTLALMAHTERWRKP